MTPTKAEIEKANEITDANLERHDWRNMIAKALADARESVERDAEDLKEALNKWKEVAPRLLCAECDMVYSPAPGACSCLETMEVYDLTDKALAAWRERHPK